MSREPKLHFRLEAVTSREEVGVASISGEANRFRFIAGLNCGVRGDPVRHRITGLPRSPFQARRFNSFHGRSIPSGALSVPRQFRTLGRKRSYRWNVAASHDRINFGKSAPLVYGDNIFHSPARCAPSNAKPRAWSSANKGRSSSTGRRIIPRRGSRVCFQESVARTASRRRPDAVMEPQEKATAAAMLSREGVSRSFADPPMVLHA